MDFESELNNNNNKNNKGDQCRPLTAATTVFNLVYGILFRASAFAKYLLGQEF